MTQFKLDRALAREIIVHIAPLYVELLRELQARYGWAKVPDKLEKLFRRANFDGYVTVFDDEKRIFVSFGLFLMGQEGFKQFNAKLAAMSPEQQHEVVRKWFDEMRDEENWEYLDTLFPDTPEQEAEAIARFNALSDEAKTEASMRAGFFWSFFFGWFYQYLALMLHGQKLTDLVAQAKAGDEEAFCKAIHVEPRLLHHHEFFRGRYELARQHGEEDFLKRIGYRLASPGTPGRIRYPGLYVVFAMLEVTGWLGGGFTHEELLDICDDAGLDRWQNRIEDVNFLAKRLREYRKLRRIA
jgi:hypothetical protein